MNSIADIIVNQHNLLINLKEVIEAEKAALIEQDADRLLGLASNKAKLLNEIKLNDESLSAHPDNAELKTNADIVKQVENATNLLEECKTLNALNGKLIEHSMASLNRFSQALQASRNASSLTYDQKGKTSTISTLGNNLKA
ncbi:flagella synthesis protein FlgN [Shewanella colwelliana]|uniref:Flagellar biosynthesis protein FlgN n=1 Tax=Shewanella colwelliana TaxID=23 RepID=A0A1E5IVP0_SHECO|nr:flagellar protein FlgN [Shewanella colwelliana]MDX1281510.1 flagellar protein FlgN [Shewanella colwelliana]OEG74602.1 flagellar biosynthesis protein FlgN [Shewanella colwelliana]GIU43577.1 flagellar protein FlgN [Shewanella colwelliana]